MRYCREDDQVKGIVVGQYGDKFFARIVLKCVKSEASTAGYMTVKMAGMKTRR